jgi:ribosomal protein S18 acetylase RimI-like enzyme
MNITIRRANKNDIGAVVILWREMWNYHTHLDKRFTTTAIANDVMTKWIEENIENENSIVLVAVWDNIIVGYCLGMVLENPPVVTEHLYGYISEIAVKTNLRRYGIGGKLIAEMHLWFRTKNASYVEVNASVYNQISRSFWRKYGYKEFLERLRLEL